MQKGMKAASPTYFELTNVNFLYVEMLHTGNYCTADYFSCIMSRLFELSMSYSGPGLVPKNFQPKLLHRILRHMHGVLRACSLL